MAEQQGLPPGGKASVDWSPPLPLIAMRDGRDRHRQRRVVDEVESTRQSPTRSRQNAPAFRRVDAAGNGSWTRLSIASATRRRTAGSSEASCFTAFRLMSTD